MAWVKIFKNMLILMFISAAAACSSPGSIPRSDTTTTSDYIIGAGDQLQVYVRNNPDLSVSVPVRPDGKVSVPMVQDMTAAGKTPSRLAMDLEASLSEFIREPTVTVMLTGFVGAYADQIRIIGQATQPQAIAYREGMTVLDAIIQVGGLTQFAAGNRAKLVRGTGSSARTYSLRLNDLINNGDIRNNHALVPGDILVIPEAYF